jgi:hypothetical protein
MTRWKAKKSNQKNLKNKGKGEKKDTKKDIMGENLSKKKMGEVTVWRIFLYNGSWMVSSGFSGAFFFFSFVPFLYFME